LLIVGTALKETHILATKIAGQLPGIHDRLGTAGERIVQDTSGDLEPVLCSPPVRLQTHMILKNSDDVLLALV
jgi:hypothetical protein